MTKNKQRRRAQRRRWYVKHREEAIARTREWRKKNPEAVKRHNSTPNAKKIQQRRNFLAHHGITLEQRDALISAAGFQCGACFSSEPGSKLGWHIDHCHKTNKIRGVLCSGCNIALGHVKDCPERLLQLVQYLEKHR